MNESGALEDWNYQVLMLVQSMVGAISPNFRMITLLREDEEWVIRFYLETNDEDDIEEIEEIMCQYGAYQTEALKCRSETVVGVGKLPSVSGVGRVVFRRRELISE
ncbi:hypothetical protein D3C72_2274490 [compost metagenome]